MRKRKIITRDLLMELGVTDVTRNGEVYVNGEIKTISLATLKHKYGKDRDYLIVQLKNVKKHKTEGFVLSRVVYAWFNGECPIDMDVDHVDNNPFNNNIDNLQLLTHDENIKKRGLGKNQFSYNLTDKEILANRQARIDNRQYVIDRQARINYLNKQLVSATELWHGAVADCDKLYASYAKELMNDIRSELKRLREEKHKTNKEN